MTAHGLPGQAASHADPIAVLEAAGARILHALPLQTEAQVNEFAQALLERQQAIGSLDAALGPRPPRLLLERLERVLADDRVVIASLEGHMAEIRRELGGLRRGRQAAIAYASYGSSRRA